MRTISSFVVSASLALLAGCSTVSEPTSAPNVPAGSVSTVTPGDYAPKQIFRLPAQKVALDRVVTSMPSSPRDVITLRNVPDQATHTGLFKLIPPGSVAGSHTFTVDSTSGEAHLYLSPHTNDIALMDAALRDIQVVDPDGRPVNVRVPKHAGLVDPNMPPMSAMPLAGLRAGVYTVALGPTAAKTGVSVDIRQPESKLVLRVGAEKQWLLQGDDVGFGIELSDNGTPITGATLHANLVDPKGIDGATLRIVELGNGKYRALASNALGTSDLTGSYRVHVWAEGTTPSGATFQRFGSSGLQFAIPTARITRTGGVRVINDGNGMITGFDVDVDVEASSLDRYDVSAVLSAIGPDGLEHPVAESHAGEGWSNGTHTLTLHFDAGQIRMTGLEGNLSLRNLQLYAQGQNALLHRMYDGQGAVAANIPRIKMIKLTDLTPALDQMVLDGVLRND